MSGIFAFTGSSLCRDRILTGLCRLENRGSELCGITERGENGITAYKTEGAPSVLKANADKIKSEGYTGIAQCKNRYRKTPPDTGYIPSSNEVIALACNGDIENFEDLKRKLPLSSYIHCNEDLLLALLLSQNEENRLLALKNVINAIDGSPSVVFMYSDGDSLYCAGGEMPLYIGYFEDGFSVTDGINAIGDGAVRYTTVEKGEFAKITKERTAFFDSRLKRIKKPLMPVVENIIIENEYRLTDSVYCLPLTVKDTLGALCDNSVLTLGGCKIPRRIAERTQRIIITGSGSCYNAAKLGAYAFEQLTDIPCAAYSAGGLRCSPAVFDRETLLICLSYSRDFDDVCACAKRAEEFGAKTLAVTVFESSRLSDLCDLSVTIKSGFLSGESGLGDFPAGVLALNLIALKIGFMNEIINSVYYHVALKIAEMLPGKISASIKSSPLLTAFSRSLINGGTVVFTGLCADGVLADEAAAKLRKTAGINAVSINLSELNFETKEFLKSAKTVAFITSKELCKKALKPLGYLNCSGAEITVITSESLAEQLGDFDNVLTFPDSLPLFNWAGAVSLVYSAAASANCMLKENSGQKAV